MVFLPLNIVYCTTEFREAKLNFPQAHDRAVNVDYRYLLVPMLTLMLLSPQPCAKAHPVCAHHRLCKQQWQRVSEGRA